jgi:hypothetical protein
MSTVRSLSSVVSCVFVSRRFSRSISISIAFFHSCTTTHNLSGMGRKWENVQHRFVWHLVSAFYGMHSWVWWQQEALFGWDPVRCAWSLVTSNVSLHEYQAGKSPVPAYKWTQARSLYNGCPWGISIRRKIFWEGLMCYTATVYWTECFSAWHYCWATFWL